MQTARASGERFNTDEPQKSSNAGSSFVLAIAWTAHNARLPRRTDGERPMKSLAFTGAILILVVPCIPADTPSSAKTHQVELNGHVFTLPSDFVIELAAGQSLVDRPIVADFDEGGRLYVADSSGSNEPVAVQVKK